MIKFEQIPEFDKDLKKLRKKYKSLDDDLKILKSVIDANHNSSIGRINGFFEIPNLKLSTEIQIWKVKKFACKSLKGKGANTRFRIIYAFIEKQEKIVFLEIYFKGNQEKEDRHRIKNYYKNNF